ncbi:hypothetical protein F4820DRAFT_84815 [Hypoxylon rubiginosum]|uniref:Uncharacterized protein n=1 Tax=Hypoxylon rubiginosum TaxID=110542 RepID=A0ACB9YQD9_9PEZI|nr:hypothetical protein F4820DRAFT_84815 [Hypoxylon rubiginosum]
MTFLLTIRGHLSSFLGSTVYTFIFLCILYIINILNAFLSPTYPIISAIPTIIDIPIISITLVITYLGIYHIIL